MKSLWLALAAASLSLACSNDPARSDASGGSANPDGGTSGGDRSGGAGTETSGTLGGDRPVTVHVPASYVDGTPAPLVILLHGFTASGDIEESYFRLTPLSDERGFLYAYPDGTLNASDIRFWNATKACCDVGNSKVDDSGYLSALIEQIQARYTVDPKRVYLVGHSNGGFMAYRMACDHSDQIAAIVSLAGAMFDDVKDCGASAPVAVLQIHGTADTTIAYDGGAILGNAYPGAKTSVEDWATIDGCQTEPDTAAASLDLDSSIAGKETTVTVYGQGCKSGGHAELWTIKGGAHVPKLSPEFSSDLVDFLFAHARP